MGRVNQLLHDDLSDLDMFITAQLAFVDGAKRRISIANAGHCPLGLASGGTVRALAPEGLPLGIQPSIVFETATAELEQDCRVLLFSDGLSEAMNAAGTVFGLERLFAWLKQVAPGTPAQKMCDELALTLDAHQAQHPLRDDQTFIVLSAESKAS